MTLSDASDASRRRDSGNLAPAALPNARPAVPGAWLSGETCALLTADRTAAEALRRLRTADRAVGVELGAIVLAAAHRRRALTDPTADHGGYNPSATTTRHGLWVTTKEAGRLIDRSDRTVRDAIDAGKLPARRNAYDLWEVSTVDLAAHAARPARTTRSRPVPTDTARRDAEAAYWQQLIDNGAHRAEVDRLQRQLARVRTIIRDGGRDVEQEAVRYLVTRAEVVERVGQLVDAIDTYGLTLNQPLPAGWSGPGSYAGLLDQLTADIAAGRASTSTTWAADARLAGEHATAVKERPAGWFTTVGSAPGRTDPWSAIAFTPDERAYVETHGRVAAVYSDDAARRLRTYLHPHPAMGTVHEISRDLADTIRARETELGRLLTVRETDDLLGRIEALTGRPDHYRGITAEVA